MVIYGLFYRNRLVAFSYIKSFLEFYIVIAGKMGKDVSIFRIEEL